MHVAPATPGLLNTKFYIDSLHQNILKLYYVYI